MEQKTSEKDFLNNNEQSKPLTKQIFDIVRSNWLALLCALIICLITIIVVPIIYTLEKPSNLNNDTNLSWDISAQTILNKTNFINNIRNDSIGIISSLAFDSEDNLYLLDKTFNRLLKYNSTTNDLVLIIGHENRSNQTDILFSPNDLFIDLEDINIYIADSFNHRIILLQIDSKETSIICGTGIAGSTINQLNQPMSLTMDEQSNIIYIADYGNNRIISFNLTNNQPNILIPHNQNENNRQTYLSTPISIKYDSTSTPSSLVIAQETGFNVVRWILNSNTNTWALIAGSASSELNGTSRTLFNKLCAIDIDSYGHTYVDDCNNQRIQFYLGDMQQGHTIAGVIQAQGNNSYTFNQPTAIALDSGYNLWVADSLNYRIQKFQQLH